jgi:hypothetical protein
MTKLGLGIDIKDFDLDRVGVAISVLDEAGKKRVSEGYLRMTLAELDTFVRALKSARGEVHTVTVEPDGLRRSIAGTAFFGARELHGAAGAAQRCEDVLPKLALRPKSPDPAEAAE